MPKRNFGYGPSGRVNILKKVKVGDAWSLYPAVVESNGKLKDKVRIKGIVEVHPEGQYFIEWWEAGKRRREQIVDRLEVLERARRKSLEMEGTRLGVPLVTATEKGEHGGATLRDAVADYLEDIRPPQREKKTYVAYKYCLEQFLATSKKRFVADVKREDLLEFIRHQYKSGCGARTAFNRANILVTFLKLNGVSGLLNKFDWPSFVDPIRPIYEPEELTALFNACRPAEHLLFSAYLLSGLRDKEMRYLTWPDVDFRRNVLRVTSKPMWDFRPKDKEEREVPVPGGLIAAFKQFQQTQPLNSHRLVFPTLAGLPDTNHELKLKWLARRAGLNCGTCISRHGNKCSRGPYCSKFFLHKFRHTFATRHLQDGTCDIRTLQTWLGHSDLASTMVYLKAARNKDLLQRINASGLAEFAPAV
ncbi:MAG TPA: site-specific integrase, partial [Acidobacteriaceae bacterium]